MKSVRVAFENLVRYRDGKKKARDEKNALAYRLMEKKMSKRQADIVAYLYVNKDRRVPMAAYAKKHDIVRQTARKDLSDLVAAGLLAEGKSGRNIVFGVLSKEAVDAYLQK